MGGSVRPGGAARNARDGSGQVGRRWAQGRAGWTGGVAIARLSQVLLRCLGLLWQVWVRAADLPGRPLRRVSPSPACLRCGKGPSTPLVQDHPGLGRAGVRLGTGGIVSHSLARCSSGRDLVKAAGVRGRGLCGAHRLGALGRTAGA